MARLVTRDPFARAELHAARVHNPIYTCGWCGSTRETKRGTRWLYQYTLEFDDGSSYEYADLHCSRGCLESYHGRGGRYDSLRRRQRALARMS